MALKMQTKQLTIAEQLKLDKANEQELTKLQREYRNFANGRYAIKEDKSKVRYLEKNLEQAQKERITISTKLNVAMGSTNVKFYEENVKKVELHVLCQEQLQKLIDTTKTQLEHLHMQTKRIEKDIYELSSNSTSEHQYRVNLLKAKQSLEMLENRVDVSKKRECLTIANNTKLRKIIDHMLYDRALFNKLWERMIVKLAHDKKFFIDMVERAILAFNQGADLCNKLDALRDKGQRDKKLHVQEMMEMLRKLDADKKTQKFLGVKGKTRELDDLEEREYLRRQMFRDDHQGKLKLYSKVIEKIKTFSGHSNIENVIELFHKREDEYFAHFNYMNELNHQVQFLTESLNDIYGDIDASRMYNDKKEIFKKDELKFLNEELMKQTELTITKTNQKDSYETRLMELMDSVTEIFTILNCDNSELINFLGDHKKVTKFNIKKFLTIVETRLNSVLSYVYANERKTTEKDKTFVVRSVVRSKLDPTAIQDVVLVQQCAECAEGEDVNRYDEEIVWPLDVKHIKEKVRDKVKAPELQYRLHNISKCRLPRSRIIVNRRYQ